MTMRLTPRRVAAAAPGPRPGCCRPRSSPARAGRGRRARRGSARPCARSPRSSIGGSRRKATRRKLGRRRAAAAVVVEGAHARALLAQQVEIDVGDRDLVAGGEALGLGEHRAVLEDRGLAVPGEVGRRFRPRRRRRRDRPRGSAPTATGRGAAACRPCRSVMLLAERLASTVAPASARLGARRHRHPEVLADLGVDDEAGQVLGREQEVGAERAPRAGRSRIVPPSVPCAGGEVPVLVELAVVRQVDLRHDAEQPAAVDGDGRVVDAAGVAQRRAEEQQRQQLRRSLRPAVPIARSTASSSASCSSRSSIA